jgi:lipopolysaccharide transport system ATP-binding protein
VRSLSDCGTTIVFVSHDLFAVERLCDTVLWLDQGRVQAYGSPCDVISAYLQSIDRRKLPDSDLTKSQGRFLRIQSVKTMDESGANVTEVRPGERLTVEVAYSAERCLGQARFALGVSTGRAGRLFYPSMLLDGRSMPVREGWATIKCHVECLPPMPGSYEIWGEVWDETGRVNLSPWALWSGFRVVDDLSALSQIASSRTASHSHDALVFVPYKWEYRACPKRLLNQKSR